MKKENKSPAFQQFKTQSIHKQTLDIIRQAVLDGEFKPGHVLTETELATQLGVSRAPIREALRILSTEGFVDTIPYRGSTVKLLSPKDIHELYSMRFTLETFALKQIIVQANPDHILRMRQLYEEMKQAGEDKDIKAVNTIDRKFHDELIVMSNHGLLHSTWQTVAMRVRQVMALRNRRNSDLTQIAQNHIPIINAIEAGDEENAILLLKQHIESAGNLMMADWIEGDEVNE